MQNHGVDESFLDELRTICDACDGTGVSKEQKRYTCQKCHGDGEFLTGKGRALFSFIQNRLKISGYADDDGMVYCDITSSKIHD